MSMKSAERVHKKVMRSDLIYLCSFQYSAFITVILAGQVALCAVTAVYKYEVSEMFTIWVT